VTIYRPTRNISVGGDLPQKFWPGGRNSGVYLRQKFWPRGGISGPPEIFISENSGPLLHGAPQLGEKDLAKFLRAKNSGISGPRKFWILRIFGPPLQAAPHPVVKDLAKFLRAGNYEISGP
jgi:hypothetical protein